MTTTLAFKPILDVPQWRPNAPPLAANSVGAALVWDQRPDASAHPLMYYLRSATAFDAYNPITDEWLALASPALTGTFGAGAGAIFHPSQGPRGTLAAGWSTTSGQINTIPAIVNSNSLANRGDGVGFRIRIIGKSAGGAGKINERTIISNTAATSPVITLDAPLDWTPAAGDGYEILSGRVFLLSAGALAAGMWKYYDIATNSFSGNLATTNLPATISTDSVFVALSELHVSTDRVPGAGFVNGGSSYDPTHSAGYTSPNCILATASSSTTITGSAMPADLQASEYQNFQVRIVEDTTNPTGVGQRAVITSHTGGATGVFTVASWPVITPSSSAKFVIENNDDLILLRTSAQLPNYSYSIAGNAWSSTAFAAASTTQGAGGWFEQPFGIVRDPTHQRVHSQLTYNFGAAVNGLGFLNIAAGSTGLASTTTVLGNAPQTFTTGTSVAYDPVTNGGRFIYINLNGTNRMLKYDFLNMTYLPMTYFRPLQGAATVGQKLAFAKFIDGTTELGFLYMIGQSQASLYSVVINP